MNKTRSISIRLTIILLISVFAVVSVLAMLRAARATAASVQEHQVGMIIDPSGLDNYFNALAASGLESAEDKLVVIGTVYTPTDQADIVTQAEQCASDGNELCIGVGFVTAEAISATAHANPDVKFAVVDSYYDHYPDNLQGIRFATEEPSYLAGTLAALMTTSDTLGVIGGLQIPPVDDFINGFRWGAQCANPDVTVAVTYTNEFNDPALGAAVAQNMLAEGADVIFPVAGSTGVGAILTATQSGAWGIGVDTDQWVTEFMSGTVPGSDKVLTSVIKQMDTATFLLISDVVSGTFISGTVVYDLEMGGVELAAYHEAGESIPDNIKDVMNRTRQGILMGTIDVNGPCPAKIYLPWSAREAASSEP